jgi:hypothetical protein
VVECVLRMSKFLEFDFIYIMYFISYTNISLHNMIIVYDISSITVLYFFCGTGMEPRV